MRRRDFIKAIIASAAGLPVLARAQQPTTAVSPVFGQPAIDAFKAEELFGVAHPDQLLSFPGTLNPATQKMMKGVGEVSYQVDGSKIIVRAEGGIAANSSHVWSIASGARSAPAQVTVIDGGSCYEMDNGLVAVRTPKTISVTPAAVLVPDDNVPLEHRMTIYASAQILAPIQSIRHRDGTWTGANPNYLYSGNTYYSSTRPPYNRLLGSPNFPATSATVEVVESGPLRAKIKMTYAAIRPAFGWPDNPDPGFHVDSSQNGYYICTIIMQAGQSVIMVEQETDGQPSWSVNMSTGASVDRARYRGWGVYNGGSPTLGHNHDGTLYVPVNQRADTDGEINLSDTGNRTGQRYDDIQTRQIPWDGVWYPHLYRWYTWEPNTGWYWHAYNSAGDSDSNVWGIFQGPAAHYLNGGETGNGGTGMYATPATGTPTEFGFYSWFTISNNPFSSYLYRRGTFGIFLGSKGTDTPVDFSAYSDFGYDPMFQGGQFSVHAPGIASKGHNLHSGTAQFWKQIDQGLDFPDPAGGFPGMYLNRTDTEALIALLVSSQGTGSYYRRLYDNDTNYRDVWDAFVDLTNVKAAALVQWCCDDFAICIDNYVNLGSIHCAWHQYWGEATRFQRIAVSAQAMLSLNQVRPFMTGTQKRQLKAVMSMMGHILWDNDFAPMDNGHGFSLGSYNMAVQFNACRCQIAALLKTHAQFSTRFERILEEVTALFSASINVYGAPVECPHYASTTVVTTTDVFRQLQIIGYADVFTPTSSIYDRLTGLAEWCMQILTPKQARFGNLRKMVPYGDSTSEGHDHFLSMIMGFEAYDLTLSKRMAGAWTDMRQPLSSFYGSSALKIRADFPTQDPALGDADFPGYMTVMRSSWGMPNESAVFLLHGSDCWDHATFQRGSPSIYLLGAPICIPFSSMYNVHVVGPWVSCSTYIPISELGWSAGHGTLSDSGAWNTFTDLNVPCGIHSALFSDTYTYVPTTNRVDLTCTFSVSGWVRHLTYYRDVLSCPIVRLRDSNTTGESVFTLHMMATDAVTKPDGSTITPTALTGTPFSIANGAEFRFVGQWGVSWDMYYFGPSAEAFIGVWINTWANGIEAGQYRQATGRSFEEKQYILRIKTAGPCDVVVVPYRAGQRPTNLKVVQVSGGLRVDPASRTLAN